MGNCATEIGEHRGLVSTVAIEAYNRLVIALKTGRSFSVTCERASSASSAGSRTPMSYADVVCRVRRRLRS